MSGCILNCEGIDDNRADDDLEGSFKKKRLKNQTVVLEEWPRSLSNQCFYWTFATEKEPENAATADLADTVERLTSVTETLEICCSHSKRHQKSFFFFFTHNYNLVATV